MKIISLSESRDAIARLDGLFADYSEMAPSEQQFLTALIQKYQPRKVVEIGIAAGSSSVLLLNALSDLPNKNLISVDYATDYYRDSSRKSGFVVDHYPELKKNWTLYTGGLVSEFVDKIGDGIDFCFIDTMHIVPGEIIDFLAIFPFLTENAVVVLHDTNLQTWGHFPNANVNNLLISALSGEKLIPEYHEKEFYHNILKKQIDMPFANIAGVVLDKVQKDRIWDVFNLLAQNWTYMPKQEDLDSFRRILKAHYNPYYVEYFDETVAYQMKTLFAQYQYSLPHIESADIEEKIDAFALVRKHKLRRRYRKYNILSKIVFGPLRTMYKQRSVNLKAQLKNL